MGESLVLEPPLHAEVQNVDSPEEDAMEDDLVLQRYNSQLPLSYRSTLDNEQKLLLRALRVLANAILNSREAGAQSRSSDATDTAHDGAASEEAPIVSEGYQNEFERDFAALEKGLNRYLDLKHSLQPEDYQFLVNVLLRGAVSPSIDMGLRSKLARTTTRLLHKRQCSLPKGIPWRPILKTIMRYHINVVTGGAFIGRDIRDAHCRNMVSLLTCCRNYLTAGDGAEKIWDEFASGLSPSTDIDQRFQDLLFLSHILPTRGDSWSGWMSKGMELWQSVESSSDWDATWMSLMGRLAKHQPCAHDWTPHLPLVYGRLTGSFYLPLGAIAPQSAIDRRSPHFCMFLADSKVIPSAAALIVYSLSPKHPETLEYLERLFALIANYFHPSNSGRWSAAIGSFLVHITANLVVRVIEERNATKAGVTYRVVSDKGVKGVAPMDERLPEDYNEHLVSLLRPLIQHGLYSKVNSMSVQAASAARDLAIISPQSVIEPFLVEACDGLESISSPHRTTAALRLLSTLTSVFLDSDFFDGGAEYLPQVLMLTLPGIDPNDLGKTESTLKFIAATSGRLQSIVASDPRGTIAVFLEDYVHQLLERIFALLESLEAPPKKGRNGTFHHGGSQLSFYLFSVTVENLFAALPEGVVRSAAQRISRQINGAACPNAIKYYAVFVRTAATAAASVSGSTSANVFIPQLLDQIVDPSTGASSPALTSVAEDELVWRIRMLAQASRCCGKGVIQYLERIAVIVRLTMQKPSRPVYKAGGRLLRGVLEGLSATQMMFGPGLGTKADSVGDGEVYAFEWKEPSPEEWRSAEEMIRSFIATAEEFAYEKKEDGSMNITTDRDVLFRVLRLLHAIQRGGRWVLAGALPEDFKVLDKYLSMDCELPKYDAKLILKRPVTAGLGGERSSSSAIEVAVGLWSRVYTLVSKIISAVLSARPDDGALLYRCLEPIELAHEPFRRGNRSQQPMHTSRAYKAVYKPIIASKRPFGSQGGVGRAMPRFILKLRIEAHHEMRLSIAARTGLCATDLFNSIIGQLTDLSVNDFRRVRGEARGVLTRSYRVARPAVRRREICRVIDVLEKSAASVSASSASKEESSAGQNEHNGITNGTTGTGRFDSEGPPTSLPSIVGDKEERMVKEGDILYDRMIGAAMVLRSSAAAPIIMRDWNLFSQVVRALLDAMLAAERQDAASAVGALFAKLSSLVRPLSIDPIRLVGEDFESIPKSITSLHDESEKSRREKQFLELNEYLLGMLNRSSESQVQDDGKKREAHWRLQSLVATVLYIILREDRCPSADVAGFFVTRMVSDVVVLRQISSKAIMFILAVHGRRAGIKHPEGGFDDSPMSWGDAGNTALCAIGTKICSEQFARKLVHTLALDHDEDSADGRLIGNAGGLFAVMNLGRSLDGDACWMLVAGKPWPSSWIPRSRDSINVVRMRLYESIVRVFGKHALTALQPTVTELIRKAEEKEEKIISGVKDEDVRVLAGEVLAGICRGLDLYHSQEGATNESLETLTISLLSDMSGRLGNVTGGTIIRLIATADEFTVGRRVWKGILNWLLRKKPIIVSMENGPVAHLQARRLRYLHSCLADVDDSKHDALALFVKETLTALTEEVGFDHELKTVREEVARSLALIASSLPPELEGLFDERMTVLCDRLGPNARHDDDSTMLTDSLEEERKKSRSRQGETMSRFVSIVHWGGRTGIFEKYVATVLPVLFSSFDESDRERISQARMALSFSAQGRFSPTAIDNIIASVEDTTQDSRWKVRSSVLAFLQVFSFASLFTASAESLHRIRTIILKLLSDSQLEVRQASAAAFVTVIRDSTPEAIDEVRADCMKVLKLTAQKKRGAKRKPMSAETICKRHGAVLGLSSMITSSPYSVPAWMPSVLVALSSCVNDPPPISTGARKIFAEFMRTHRDEWASHKLAFTPDELEVVSELLVSPSYYA